MGKLKIREIPIAMRIVITDEVRCAICNVDIEERNYLFGVCLFVR